MKARELRIIVPLAWRNVWRNKRRTILTLLTILVGCAMIILMNAFSKGGHDRMIEDATSMNAGHIQIHEKGYWDSRTIDYAFRMSTELEHMLRGDPRVAGYSLRVHADGLLSFGESTAGAMIQGVDPVMEKKVGSIHTRILKGGRYLKQGDSRHIVMGETLAKNLGASTGDRIVMISQGFDGSIAAERLEVVGLFRSGNPEYDQALIVMPLSQAAETFTMMGYVHSCAIRLRSSSDMERIRDGLRAVTGLPDTIEVLGWDELMPELVQFIVMDDIQAYIFDFILFMIVAFGILNTIQMSVFERTREFGVMLAIGTRPDQVISIVLVESFFISIMGIALGIALGAGISYYYWINPIDFSSYSEEMAVWGVSTVIYPADATALNLLMTAIVTFVLALVFSIFPARRASRLRPIEAIRHL